MNIILTAPDNFQPCLVPVSLAGYVEEKWLGEMSTKYACQGLTRKGPRVIMKKWDVTSHYYKQLIANQTFKRYLTITGGRTAVEKILFYTLLPDQKRESRRYLSRKEVTVAINLTENFGEVEKYLKQYEEDSPHKRLGVFIDPTCANKEQVIYMTGNSRDWGNMMIGPALVSVLKLFSFRTKLLQNLRYPIPVSPLRDLNQILAPALISIKHTLWLPRSERTDTILFPGQYGGYGIIMYT